MLTDLCQEIKNWFDRDMPKLFGKFTVRDGEIYSVDKDGVETALSVLGLADNQYYRIVGSVFNDGVHQHPAADLSDETFNGAVWFMAIPQAVVSLSEKIKDWQDKYGDTAVSPFTSESFGGYSYSKSGSSSADGGSQNTWQSVFKKDLNRWRKI